MAETNVKDLGCTKDGLHHHVVPLEGCGSVSVFVQGDLDKLREGYVFLTLHDVGANHQSWVNFSKHPSMSEITGRCLFLHVDLPGQEPGAKDLSADFSYPTMQNLGTNLLTVLDQLRVSRVVGLGMGAGGNIMARFAMMHPGRCHGVVLLNTTSSVSSMIKQIKDKVNPLKSSSSSNSEALNSNRSQDMNKQNVERYTDAFKKRAEFLSTLNARIKIDVLMLCGQKSKYINDADAMQMEMKPGTASLIKLEDICDPLNEAPDKTAESILLFCQGLGLLPAINRRNSRSNSTCSSDGEGNTRRMSMEQYDVPNIRRLSLTAN